MRKTQFQNEYYYHIYNRGVDKREIFMDENDYIRFLRSMREFNDVSGFAERIYIKNRKTAKELNSKALELSSCIAELPKLVDIICYSLLPNHYHFLLKQFTENGIKIFMHKLGTGYTNYFNLKNDRTGSLFEGRYKSVPVKTDEYLVYLSAYINGNPEIHRAAKAQDWIWSSYKDYLGSRQGNLCNKKVVLEQFSNDDKYQNYVNSVINNSRERKDEIKKYFLE